MPPENDRGTGSLDPASDPADAAGLDAVSGDDPLSATLRAIRLTGALFFVVDATSPWCIDVPEARAYARIILPRAAHVLSYHVVVEGSGWAGIPGTEPIRIGPGDILVFPHGDPYVMRSAPDAPPEFDREGTLAFFRALVAGELPFVVTEGGGAAPPAKFICGFLGCQARPFNPILASLPRMLRLERPEAGGDLLDRLIALTLEEARAGRAGGASVRLRLSELMFMELLRRYAAAPGPKPPGWLCGLQDRHVAQALEAIHARPADPWTVAGLARVAGLSRSAFATRFAARTGDTPIRYLAHWRMLVATGVLADEPVSIAEVASAVGYGSEAAFSRGFKKIVGVSPDAWRRGEARQDQPLFARSRRSSARSASDRPTVITR